MAVLTASSQSFLAVLVIATPCPLPLVIPGALIGAISVAASRGIIIRNPAMEQIDSCRTNERECRRAANPRTSV